MPPPGGRALLQRPMWPVRVVVIDVLAENEPEMPLARDQHLIQASRRALPTQRSAIAFARGARTGALMIRMPAAVNTASNAAVTSSAPSNRPGISSSSMPPRPR